MRLVKNLSVLVAAVAVTALVSSSSWAGFVTSTEVLNLSAGNGSITGGVYTQSGSGGSGSNTFNYTLTITGSPGSVSQATFGIGVTPGNEINPGESLTSTLAITSFTGAPVTFDGFTGFTLNNFGGIDEGVYTAGGSAGAFSSSSVMFTAGEPLTVSPTAGSFRLATVSAQFTQAVPVPGAALLALLGAGIAAPLRKRLSRRPAAV